MSEQDEKILEYYGWEVECDSPLEIRHKETGSFATLVAAEIVLAYFRKSYGRPGSRDDA